MQALGGEANNVRHTQVIPQPDLFQGLALALEHIPAEFILRHFGNGDHNHKLQSVPSHLGFSDAKPQGSNVHRCQIQVQLLSNIADVGKKSRFLLAVKQDAVLLSPAAGSLSCRDDLHPNFDIRD